MKISNKDTSDGGEVLRDHQFMKSFVGIQGVLLGFINVQYAFFQHSLDGYILVEQVSRDFVQVAKDTSV